MALHQPRSPRSTLPPCFCTVSRRRANFIRGDLSTDARILYFHPHDPVEEKVTLPLTEVTGVRVVRKEQPFVLLSCMEVGPLLAGNKREICFYPSDTTTGIKGVMALKEALGCLVSVASGRPMDQVLEDDEEGSLLARFKSPRASGGGSNNSSGGSGPAGGGKDKSSPRSSDGETSRGSNDRSASPRSLNASFNASGGSGSIPGLPLKQPSLGRKLGDATRSALSPVSGTSKPPRAAGWLWKQFHSTWKCKYFMLMESNQLVYYESEEMSRVKGHAGSGFIDMTFMQKARTKGSAEFDGRTLWIFEIVLSTGRQWLLAAEAPERCIWWLQLLTPQSRRSGSSSGSSSRIFDGGAGGTGTGGIPLAQAAHGSGALGPSRGVALSAHESGTGSPRVRDMASSEIGPTGSSVIVESFEFDSNKDSDAPAPSGSQAVPILDRLGTSLSCYEPDSARATTSVDTEEFLHSLKQHLGFVLSLDDEEFYGEDILDDTLAPTKMDARFRSETSSDIDRVLHEMDAKIFGDLDSSGVEAAVYATIEEYAAKRGGGDDTRIETAAKLKGRIQTIILRKSNPSSSNMSWDEGNLPSLPDTVPSIHDHAAYRDYVRLRRAHDRSKRKGGGWARAVNQSGSITRLPAQASVPAPIVGTPPPDTEAPRPPVFGMSVASSSPTVGTPPPDSEAPRAHQALATRRAGSFSKDRGSSSLVALPSSPSVSLTRSANSSALPSSPSVTASSSSSSSSTSAPSSSSISSSNSSSSSSSGSRLSLKLPVPDSTTNATSKPSASNSASPGRADRSNTSPRWGVQPSQTSPGRTSPGRAERQNSAHTSPRSAGNSPRSNTSSPASAIDGVVASPRFSPRMSPRLDRARTSPRLSPRSQGTVTKAGGDGSLGPCSDSTAEAHRIPTRWVRSDSVEASGTSVAQRSRTSPRLATERSTSPRAGEIFSVAPPPSDEPTSAAPPVWVRSEVSRNARVSRSVDAFFTTSEEYSEVDPLEQSDSE